MVKSRVKVEVRIWARVRVRTGVGVRIRVIVGVKIRGTVMVMVRVTRQWVEIFPKDLLHIDRTSQRLIDDNF